MLRFSPVFYALGPCRPAHLDLRAKLVQGAVLLGGLFCVRKENGAGLMTWLIRKGSWESKCTRSIASCGEVTLKENKFSLESRDHIVL